MKNINILKRSTILLALSCIVSHGATIVSLGTAQNYTILSKAGISTTGTTSIVGDIGISPIAGTAFTGFSETLDPTGAFATSTLVTGRLFAASYTAPTPSVLGIAVGDMETAYTDAAGRTGTDFLNLASGNLDGETLAPGLYTWNSALNVTNSITFSGSASDVWILQVENRFNLANDAQILLAGGAQASNIFWQTAEGATLGTNSHFEGILLTATDIAVQTNATVNGNLLAQTAVTLEGNAITPAILPIPEPSTSLLLIGGLAAFIGVRRR
jgi:hypothetical protein